MDAMVAPRPLFCTEPSNSLCCSLPAKLFPKTLTFGFDLLAFITPKEKGQEEISRPEFMSIRNRRADLRNSRRENGNQFKRMTDGFEAQRDS